MASESAHRMVLLPLPEEKSRVLVHHVDGVEAGLAFFEVLEEFQLSVYVEFLFQVELESFYIALHWNSLPDESPGYAEY